MSTTTRYEFLRHMTSGDIFAVQLDAAQNVIASVGPVAAADLTNDPSDFGDNMADEDNAWFAEQDAAAGAAGAFRLLAGAELAQTVAGDRA